MTRKEWVVIIVSILVIIGGFLLYYKNKPNSTSTKEETYDMKVGPVVGYITSKSKGTFLTDKLGMTLYTYGGDTKLESRCDGECLTNWKIYEFDNQTGKLFTDDLSKKMNIIKRSDNWRQYAYGERPVYFYKGDVNIGDTGGDGLEGGKWSIINLTMTK